jgi:hypothetical protein
MRVVEPAAQRLIRTTYQTIVCQGGGGVHRAFSAIVAGCFADGIVEIGSPVR